MEQETTFAKGQRVVTPAQVHVLVAEASIVEGCEQVVTGDGEKYGCTYGSTELRPWVKSHHGPWNGPEGGWHLGPCHRCGSTGVIPKPATMMTTVETEPCPDCKGKRFARVEN